MNILRINCQAGISWIHLSAVDQGELCGMVECSVPKGAADCGVYLSSLFVVESKRRSGCGRSLVKEVVRLSKADGFRAVWLKVASDNEAAKRLYESEGFFPMGFDATSNEQTWVLDLSK